jgi:hypothetical protein
MKQPTPKDFTVEASEAGIIVTFTPTESIYSYFWLADQSDIQSVGPISSDYKVRHAKTGDTGSYRSSEVEAIAYQLARDLASRWRSES